MSIESLLIRSRFAVVVLFLTTDFGAFHSQTIAAYPIEHTLTGLDVVRDKYGLRGAGQAVAIIDTGIAYDHIALGGGFGTNYRVIGGWDFADASPDDPYDLPGDLGGHGTHVSGIVGADTGAGDSGVAPSSDLVALRVFNDTGSGFFGWVEEALGWVHNNRNLAGLPITTVNISIGGSWNDTTIPDWATLEPALEQLESDGIFISVSAGNDFISYNQPGLSYPASSPHVVAAMSVDDNGQLSYFSQRLGRAIGAPGRTVRTTQPDYEGDQNGIADDFGIYSGTDMAAPYVAGASVIIREAMAIAGTTNITQQMIYDQMRSNADVVFDPLTNLSYYRLNLARTIDAIMPADDVGSTIDTAAQLGNIGLTTSAAGSISTIDDIDCFTLTSENTGIATLTTTATHYLSPSWMVVNEIGEPILSQHGSDVTFSVISGHRYWLVLTTDDAIGNYQFNVAIQPGILGDYNADGNVDAADYTLWKNSIGETTDLRADGNLNGRIDEQDYEIWRQGFAAATPAQATQAPPTPEPETPKMIMTAFLSHIFVRRCRSFRCEAAR